MTAKKKYIVEYDDKAKYYRIVVIKHWLGYRCGYVSVDEKHKLYKRDYMDKINVFLGNSKISTCAVEDILNVHGGVTYSGYSSIYPVRTRKPIWWFGFDAGHAGDDDEGGRPLRFMIDQAEKLVDQLRDLNRIIQ